MKTFQKLIASRAGFISPDELAAAERIQAKIDHLVRQLHRYQMPTRASRLLKAENAYLEDPSDANLEALEAVLLWRIPFASSANGEDPVSRLIHRVREGVLLDEVLPWAFPIWLRALDLFRRHFLESEKKEATRILEVTGKPMTHSDVLHAFACEMNEWIGEGFRAGYIVSPDHVDIFGSAPEPMGVNDLEPQNEDVLIRYGVSRFRFVASDRWSPTGVGGRPVRAIRTPSTWLEMLGIDYPKNITL